MTKQIYINSGSGFRDIGGTNESFTITKTVSLFNKLPQRARLLSARIPFSFNNITSSNNAYQLIEGATTHPTATITPGHYTGSSLATAFQTSLNATVGKVNTYTVSFDSNTYKYTISANGNFQLNFNITDSLGPALGFGETETASATSVVSPYVANALPDTEIFIGSNLISGVDNGIVPYFTGTATDYHVLGVVPICSSCFGSIIDYTAPDNAAWLNVNQSLFSQVNTSTYNGINSPVVLSFNLFFLSGIPVSLNNISWSAEILLDF